MPDLNRFILSTVSLLVASTSASTSTSAGPSVWDHNGSQMLLQSQGSQRTITYLIPRPGLKIQPGEILFLGRRRGNLYEGTAFLFRSGCQPASFAVRGALGSETQIIVSGATPQRSTNGSRCEIVNFSSDPHSSRLVFTYLRKYEGPVPQQIQRPQTIEPQTPQDPDQEGPRISPVQKIVQSIPGGKITIRSQDEDAPAETPIRVDIIAQCFNGSTVSILKSYKTCAFLGIRALKDGSGFDLHELKFSGGTCSISNTSRIQTHDLCK